MNRCDTTLSGTEVRLYTVSYCVVDIRIILLVNAIIVLWKLSGHVDLEVYSTQCSLVTWYGAKYLGLICLFKPRLWCVIGAWGSQHLLQLLLCRVVLSYKNLLQTAWNPSNVWYLNLVQTPAACGVNRELKKEVKCNIYLLPLVQLSLIIAECSLKYNRHPTVQP